MKHHLLSSATQSITAAALRHGSALPERLMAQFSINKRAALALLGELVAAHWLVREGSARSPHYKPGPLRQVVQRYALATLREDQAWAQDFAPFFELRPSVARLAQHAFSELLNNAIDHSGGSQVTLSLRQTAMHLQLLVSDDGCGLFDCIQRSFDIADPQMAMLELSKGKLTTQPEQHSGHGLFFTSRLADIFDLHANAAAYRFCSAESGHWAKGRPLARPGTSIYWAVALDSPRSLQAVLQAHSVESQAHCFDSTALPLHLMLGPQVGLESRGQAKRVLSLLPQFRRAELDFSGVDEIGHGFADELFRVLPRLFPEIELRPVGMAPNVAAMVASVHRASA